MSGRKLEKKLTSQEVLSSGELVKLLGHRMAIKRAVDSQLIYPLGSGFYASPRLDPFVAAVIVASRYYPEAIISNLTALVIHELADEQIAQVDIDIPRRKLLRNKLLRVHRAADFRLVGMMLLKYHGHRIRIYDLERSLCEAYLIDPGGALFFKALKRYLKHTEPRIEKIRAYDQQLKTKVLLHLTQELADA